MRVSTAYIEQPNKSNEVRVSTAYIEQPNKSHQCYCTRLEGRIRDLEKDMLNLRLGQVESQIASLKQKKLYSWS